MANGHTGSENNAQGEGQLRYWTADMCNKSPHLFDFVVTVSSFTSEGLAVWTLTYHTQLSLAVTVQFSSRHGSSNASYHPSFHSRSAHSVSSPISTSRTTRR